MSVFLLKRLLMLAATLLGASAVVFGVLEVLPGNAAQTLMGPDAAPRPCRRWPSSWDWTSQPGSATCSGCRGCCMATWD